MKFLLVLLLTLAVASASVISRKNVDLMDDGTVVIRGDHGKLMKIYKEDGVHGQTKVEIQVTGPNTVMKKIEIDENNRVVVKNGNQYHIPLTVDDTKNYEGDRGKRSFMFGRQNEVLDKAIYGDMDETNWNTLLSKEDVDARLVGDLPMHTLTDEVGLDDSIIRKMHEMDPMMYNTIRGMRRMSWPMMNMDIDKRTKNSMLIKILMKMFDQKVMMHLLNSYGVDQIQNEMILDKVLSTEGIFDKRVLMELIHDTLLRNLMIKHKIFDTTIMEMNRQVTSDELEHFINRQVLKNWMITFGCCNKDILKRLVHETIIHKMMTTERMDHLWLMNVMEDSMLTRFLVQKGIFNVDILEKCLFNLKRNMMIGENLLNQLINRRMLKVQLMLKGFIDTTMLDQMMENEILGLKVLLNVLMLNETPKMTYRQMMVNKPEWMMGQMRRVPLDDDLVRTTMNSRMLEPVTVIDEINSVRDSVTPYGIWDILSEPRRGLDRQMMIENTQDWEGRRKLDNRMSMLKIMQ
ncbi:hypothetical protein WA026_012109 [Henosepilachna vigintioctopunctata]|uniref:Uncharacterized protein n=1 Tax=Henosepilachna vigintioctopunctata TaxID=420089 RepID=A0AAW1V674_9CUCU